LQDCRIAELQEGTEEGKNRAQGAEGLVAALFLVAHRFLVAGDADGGASELHAGRRSRICAVRSVSSFRDFEPSPHHFLQSCNPETLQLLRLVAAA